MDSRIFLIGQDNQLTELRQSPYDSEALLQRLLAEHPSVLGAADPSGQSLLLICRELGVPGEQDGSDRWSLDHLFVDREGVPVLVEVKRASDTRVRREVVAQMLDYAANGVTYLPTERLVTKFSETAHQAGSDPDGVLAEFLGDTDPDSYWRQVEANLRAGRVRLIFVADRIPPELRRIVEFLNEQMRPAEVLAVEVEQFASSDGLRTLVPRLVGATQRAQAAKAVQEALPPISEQDWLASLGAKFGSDAEVAAQHLLVWLRATGFSIAISKSQDSMSAAIRRSDGTVASPFFLRRSTGKIETSLQYLHSDPAFASELSRQRLLDRLKAVPGVSITTTNLNGWPAIPIVDLRSSAVRDAFQAIAGDVAVQLRADRA